MPGPYSRSITQPYQKPLSTLDRSLPDNPLATEVGICLMPEFSNHENTFEVDIRRNYLGLGFSITGGVEAPGPWTNLIRIKKIFPLQPAWQTGKLKVGDILLKVSGVPLSSLNLRQALDILRTSPPTTCLLVCRLPDPGTTNNRSSPTNQKARSSIYRSYSYGPSNAVNTWQNFKAAEQQELGDVRSFGDFNTSYPLLSSTGDSMEIEVSPATPEKEWSPADLAGREEEVGDDNTMDLLRPVEDALRSTRVVGQFSVTLTKVNGSLGFSLQSTDDNVLNHTIKAIVREPAVSDGRLKVGDKLVSANGVDLSTFSHQELIMFLRQCEDTVHLGLYRDNSRSQTPLDADPPSSPPLLARGVSPARKHLRYEAKELVRSLQSSRTSLEKAGLTSQPGSYTSSGTLGRRRGRPFSPQLPQAAAAAAGSRLFAAAGGSPVPTVESPVSAPSSLAVTAAAFTTLSLQDEVDRIQIVEVDQDASDPACQSSYVSSPILTSPGQPDETGYAATSSPLLTSPSQSFGSPNFYLTGSERLSCSVQILSAPSSPLPSRSNNLNNNNSYDSRNNSFSLQQQQQQQLSADNSCDNGRSTTPARRPRDLHLNLDAVKQKRQGYIFSPTNKAAHF